MVVLSAVVFTVTRTEDPNGTVDTPRTVAYAASGLSADDFVGNTIPTGVLTFAPGVYSQSVTLLVKQDAVIEADETLTVSLSEESNGATVGTRSASVVIQSDDARFDIAQGSDQAAAVLEGTSANGQSNRLLGPPPVE